MWLYDPKHIKGGPRGWGSSVGHVKHVATSQVQPQRCLGGLKSQGQQQLLEAAIQIQE